jgi:copper chaperone CopZ
MNLKTLGLVIFLALSPFSSWAGPIFVAKISGMHCGSCAGKISAQLEALPEVATAKVSFKTKTAIITLKEGQTLTSEKIKSTIDGAGDYQASDIQMK